MLVDRPTGRVLMERQLSQNLENQCVMQKMAQKPCTGKPQIGCFPGDGSHVMETRNDIKSTNSCRKTPAPATDDSTRDDSTDAYHGDDEDSRVWRQKAIVALEELRRCHARAVEAEAKVRMMETRYHAVEVERDGLEEEVRKLRRRWGDAKKDVSAIRFEASLLRERVRMSKGDDDTKDDCGDGYGDYENGWLTEYVKKLTRQVQMIREEKEHLQENIRRDREEMEKTRLKEDERLKEEWQQQEKEAQREKMEMQVHSEQIRKMIEELQRDNQGLMKTIEQLEGALYETEVDACARVEKSESEKMQLQEHVDALEQQVHDLEQELQDTRTYMEEIQRQTASAGEDESVPADMVDRYREELDDLRIELASREEKLAEERKRSAALHEQLLGHMIELEEYKKNAKNVSSLQQEVDKLKKSLSDAKDVPKPLPHDGESLHEMRQQIESLERELVEKDELVMKLEGQLYMHSAKHDSMNWLTG